MNTSYRIRLDFQGVKKVHVSRWLGRNGIGSYDWMSDVSESASFSESEAISLVLKYGGRLEPLSKEVSS